MWLRANGGPIAIVIVGLTVAGFTTPLGWLLVASGSIYWLVGWYRRRETAAPTPDGRPISVRIDREPEWRNFNHVAWILQLHVAVENQTEGSKQVRGYVWRNARRLDTFGDIEVAREIARLESDRPQLRRHAILEPGVPESGWVISAADWTPDGKLPAFSFLVGVEGIEYEAMR